MFYEAQVAGVGEGGWRGPFVRGIKRLSLAELATRRGEVVRVGQDVLGTDLLVNGGGSGSVGQTAADPVLTEVTAGSGLLVPALFDHYSTFRPRPAAFFGLDVVRPPAPGYATAFSGGYIASGAVGPDRWPTPLAGRLTGSEGAGEVQTPLKFPAGGEPGIGSRVWFRHAKAGEVMERFDRVHLYDGAGAVRTATTYRGDLPRRGPHVRLIGARRAKVVTHPAEANYRGMRSRHRWFSSPPWEATDRRPRAAPAVS